MRNRGEPALDFADHRSEGAVRRSGAVALDEHLLDHVLREAVIQGARGASGLADTALGGVLGLRPKRAADHQREEHEAQPAPDRLLAMLGTPTSGSSGQSFDAVATIVACRLRTGTRRCV